MKVLESLASQCRLYDWTDLDADVVVYKLDVAYKGEEEMAKYVPLKKQKIKVTVEFTENKFIVLTKSQKFVCMLSYLDYKACELICIDKMPQRMVIFDIYFKLDEPPF